MKTINKKNIPVYLFILLILTSVCDAAADQAKFDPNKLTPEAYGKATDKQVFDSNDGNTYRIKKAKTYRGLFIKVTKDNRTKWLKHGLHYNLYDNGQISSQTTYFYGKKHGEYKAFNRKGVLEFHYYYQNGLRHGPWVQYRDKGSVFEKCTYKEGKKNGMQYNYYHVKNAKKGPVQFESNWVEGIRNGETLHYNKKGKIISRKVYQNGKQIGKTQWYH